jgi:hypothetical protein
MMTRTILAIAFTGALCVAQTTSNADQKPADAKKGATKSPAKKAQAKSTPAPVIKIPAGAVKTDDGYRYTDAAGKVWIYHETPFGVSHVPETKPVAQPETPKADPDENVKARAEGDVIHFERPVPFGTTKWDRKVNELTPQEQKIWEREQAKRAQ